MANRAIAKIETGIETTGTQEWPTTPVGQCECGCGAMTNPGRQFRPGHDQRMKGILIRAATGNGPMADAASTELVKRGWRTATEVARIRATPTREQRMAESAARREEARVESERRAAKEKAEREAARKAAEAAKQAAK